MSTDLDTAIEQVLRDLAPASRYQTRQVVDRIVKLGFDNSAVYKRLLALAPRCPAGRQDKAHPFNRFGHVCYPWIWSKLPPGQPLIFNQEPSRMHREGHVEPATITLDDGQLVRLAERVAALLREGGELTLATVGPTSDEPEECILCGEQFTDGEGGVCRTCIGPEKEEV